MENITKIMGQMQEAQAKVQEIQQKLVLIEAVGEAGAGAVKATVNGRKKIIKIDIDKAFIQPEEKEILQDLVIAAITLAMQNVEEKIHEEVKQHTAGILGSLPVDLLM